MCVWTICIDVKLLLVVLVFPVSTLGLQGAQAHCGYLCQRSYSTMGEAEIDHLRVPAPIFIFVNGDRLSQVPACRLVFQFPLWIMLHLNLRQNFGVNRFQSTVRFSQSDLLLTSSDGTVAFCKDKERILIQWCSRQVIQFSCQTLGDCLCTPDALHNSNSIRYF